MSITSDELNFLVYRYLHESGFRHSAFTFGCESMVAKSNINGSKIPPGQLVNIIQKGIMYANLERSVADDGSDVPSTEPFSVLRTGTDVKVNDATLQPGSNERESSLALSSEERGGAKRPRLEGESSNASAEASATNGVSIDTPDDEVLTLTGHTSEVFICAWNPSSLLLASGSGDSTARIWKVPEGPYCKGQAVPEPLVLQHSSKDKEKSKDVTTLDWNHNGTALATGSYDGQARIWTTTGKLTATLVRHHGPIFSLKWNSTGQYLLSGSVDKTAIIWDVETGSLKQQFSFHKEPTLDVDWRDETSFASCSTDKMIYVCKLNSPSYLKCFQGHRDEVNAIKWDPSGQLLASCSDDSTAKLWSMGSTTPVHDLRQHTKEIYTIKWSPTGPGSANPGSDLVLASASFDATVRIWDPYTGQCRHVLSKHSDPVYSVDFSSNGQFLASGSFDRSLYIWSVKDGSLVKTYRGQAGIFEVSWNAEGTKVAACFSDNTVSVIDVRM
ncbi:hypothetical protein AB1Y20_009168 [Prymnesium parvum]|uniref:Uncharacterized protein n=1 Tax=Prymnesium parvum TaxID=97485 RepID=A0AB34K3J9_PRYPA|mmetsp:Transcript_3336/g.8305  ORF Transcript_3336/g.8305 Transcript_3336/m.8305 type:complete len:500 (-) Transcript_3336:266-1765(-)